jgi:hydroxymethylpyrimidine/phosphomethylpyrimidine kinase
MKKALTIAGSDSGGGAGIQQDLKVFSTLKVFGTSVICAVTAQNTLGVQDFEALSPSIVSAQIDSVMQDIRPDAVKTGMLVNSGIIDVVCKKAKQYRIKNLVVDPVMVSTSGQRLLDEEAVESMRKLFSAALLSTPNIPEAEALSGIRIRNHNDMQGAAREIGSCLVKGGHLDGTDYLFYDGKMTEFRAKTVFKGKIHGTGCALSAAITAYLAHGYDVQVAVGKAKEYIDEAISRVFPVGGGLPVLDTGGINAGRPYRGKKR